MDYRTPPLRAFFDSTPRHRGELVRLWCCTRNENARIFPFKRFAIHGSEASRGGLAARNLSPFRDYLEMYYDAGRWYSFR